jgi:hypothetical protein
MASCCGVTFIVFSIKVYVTVDPDLRFRVSSRTRDEFHNGVIYYDLNERPIRVPAATAQQPDRSALEWHSTKIFRD